MVLVKDFDIETREAALAGLPEFRGLGQSRTVKMSFESEAYMKHYIVHWIKFG